MSELIKLSVRQQLLPPDKLAYELNLIPTPEKLSQQSKNKYVFYGLGLGLVLGISFATYMYFKKERKKEES
jgi:hypothetical protein